MTTPLRVQRVCVISPTTLNDSRQACLRAALPKLFPSFSSLKPDNIVWISQDNLDEAKKHKGGAVSALVIFTDTDMVPPGQTEQLATKGSYAIWARFFAEQPASKQLVLGGYNRRFYAYLYADDGGKWYVKNPQAGEIFGPWPEVIFDPDAKAA